MAARPVRSTPTVGASRESLVNQRSRLWIGRRHRLRPDPGQEAFISVGYRQLQDGRRVIGVQRADRGDDPRSKRSLSFHEHHGFAVVVARSLPDLDRGHAWKDIDAGSQALIQQRNADPLGFGFRRTGCIDQNSLSAGWNSGRGALDERTRLDGARLAARIVRNIDFGCLDDDGSLLIAFTQTDLRGANVVARRIAAAIKNVMAPNGAIPRIGPGANGVDVFQLQRRDVTRKRSARRCGLGPASPSADAGTGA